MDRSEFDEDLQIDPRQLDIEACRQGGIFFKWAERAVSARAEVDRLKLAMEVTEATLQLDIRNDPDRFGLTKTTEAGIQARVKCHDKYTRAVERFYATKEASLLLDRAVESLEQKKRMLEVLITLHGQEYFAGPSVPRDLVGAWKDGQKKVKERVHDKQRGLARRKDRKESNND